MCLAIRSAACRCLIASPISTFQLSGMGTTRRRDAATTAQSSPSMCRATACACSAPTACVRSELVLSIALSSRPPGAPFVLMHAYILVHACICVFSPAKCSLCACAFVNNLHTYMQLICLHACMHLSFCMTDACTLRRRCRCSVFAMCCSVLRVSVSVSVSVCVCVCMFACACARVRVRVCVSVSV